MDRNAGNVLTMVKALVEFAVNATIDAVAPPARRQAVPVIAMTEREWMRAQARRRGFGHL